MSWKDNLLPASYNGVPFKVDEVETVQSRRTAIHEYPRPKDMAFESNTSPYPYVEDLGKGPTIFHIIGFVIMDADSDWNYFEARDALRNELDKPGPGRLIHPSYGERAVSLINEVSIKEEFTKSGGMATFRMEFVEVSRSTGIIVTRIDPAVEYTQIYEDTYVDISKQTFEENYQTMVEVPTETKTLPVVPDVVKSTSLSDILHMYRFAWRIVQTNPRNFVQQMISIFVFDIRRYMNIAPTTVNTAASVAGAIDSIISEIPNLTPLEYKPIPPNVTSLILLSYFGDEDTTSPGYTYGSKLDSLPNDDSVVTTKQTENRIAFTDLVKSMALIYAGKSMLTATYASYEDMAVTRDLYSNRVESILETTTNDELYSMLDDMHSLVITGLVQLGASLKHYVNIAIPAGISTTLTLAYDKYEDIDREEEIIDSNITITHPGFLPGGESIRILEE